MAVRIRWFYGQATGGYTSVSCIGLIDVDVDINRCIYRYRKNSEIIPGAYVFQKALFEGLIFGEGGWGRGLIYKEVTVSKSVRLIIGGKFAF